MIDRSEILISPCHLDPNNIYDTDTDKRRLRLDVTTHYYEYWLERQDDPYLVDEFYRDCLYTGFISRLYDDELIKALNKLKHYEGINNDCEMLADKLLEKIYNLKRYAS